MSRYRETEGLAQKEEMRDLSRSEIEKLIDEWIIGKNSERDRAILKRRWLDGILYEPLAEEFDLSVRQVRNIVHKTEEKVLKHV